MTYYKSSLQNCPCFADIFMILFQRLIKLVLSGSTKNYIILMKIVTIQVESKKNTKLKNTKKTIDILSFF